MRRKLKAQLRQSLPEQISQYLAISMTTLNKIKFLEWLWQLFRSQSNIAGSMLPFLSQMLYALEDYTVYELESKALTTISSTKMYLQNGRCLILFKSFKGNSTCKMSAMCRCHPAASRKVKGGSSMHQIGSGFCMLLLLLYLTASLHFMSNTALPACEIFWCSVLHWTALAFGDRQTDTCTYGSRVGAASFVSGRSGWQT